MYRQLSAGKHNKLYCYMPAVDDIDSYDMDVERIITGHEQLLRDMTNSTFLGADGFVGSHTVTSQQKQ